MAMVLFLNSCPPEAAGRRASFTALLEEATALSPSAGLIFDKVGNLYGTTLYGGTYGSGTVYELTTSRIGLDSERSPHFPRWKRRTLCLRRPDLRPVGQPLRRPLYAGQDVGGTAFKLAPSMAAGCIPWFTVLPVEIVDRRPISSWAGLVVSTDTLNATAFRAQRFSVDTLRGGWTYTSLYNFTGGNDGGDPLCNVIFDSNGNLYGTPTLAEPMATASSGRSRRNWSVCSAGDVMVAPGRWPRSASHRA